MAHYLKRSSHPFYGSVVALVMLSFYEVLIIWSPSPKGVIRNAPDVWLREILFFAGVSPQQMSFVLILFSFISIIYFNNSTATFEKHIFARIIAESVVLAVISGALIQWVMARLLLISNSITGSIIGDLGLSIGAGLFEELFFRVFLTTLLIWVGIKLLKRKLPAVILAVLIASFLFSTVHYIGLGSDSFELYSFIFRFLAGIWFTTIYATRGFAVVSLTHAFYDIFVLVV